MLEIQTKRELGGTGARGGGLGVAGREARNEARHTAAIVVEAGKCGAEKTLFRCDDRNVDDSEAEGENERDEPAQEGERKSSSNEHGAEIERIASERVRAACSELAIFLYCSGGPGANRETGEDEKQAPEDCTGMERLPPKFEEVERGGEEAERDANATGDALPTVDCAWRRGRSVGWTWLWRKCAAHAGAARWRGELGRGLLIPGFGGELIGGAENIIRRDGEHAGFRRGAASVIAKAVGAAQHTEARAEGTVAGGVGGAEDADDGASECAGEMQRAGVAGDSEINAARDGDELIERA